MCCGVVVWALALGLSVRPHLAAAPATAPAGPQEVAVPAGDVDPPSSSDCLMCHGDASAMREDGTPVFVSQEVFEASVHGFFSCVDCHQDLAAADEWPHPQTLARVDCSMCHTEAVERYNVGVHATPLPPGGEAATCVDCHGMHDMRYSADPESRTHHLRIAATCGRCHGAEDVRARLGRHADVAGPFADSIHGRALDRAGLIVAPTCSDCHNAHDVLRPTDPTSPVAAANVPSTCGTCHEGIERQFSAGVHGVMLEAGVTAPACQTCHTAHAIPRGESHAWQLSVIGQCGTCHTDRVATFKDTFHGQVTALGGRMVAGCADCHGAHEILPASDPRSPIAPANLVQTCGTCHPNANENFVKYDPHADRRDRHRNPALYWTAQFMHLLLGGVFAFFGLHTTLWFAKEVRERRDRRREAQRRRAEAAERARRREAEQATPRPAPGREDADGRAE
jgi:hypothetical protein